MLESLKQEKREAIVPSLWQLEVINVLSVAEKRERISTAEALHFLDLLLNLPILVDEGKHDMKDLLLLSKTYALSAYDAAYLDLAVREQVPLATRDIQLSQAATLARVPLLEV